MHECGGAVLWFATQTSHPESQGAFQIPSSSERCCGARPAQKTIGKHEYWWGRARPRGVCGGGWINSWGVQKGSGTSRTCLEVPLNPVTCVLEQLGRDIGSGGYGLKFAPQAPNNWNFCSNGRRRVCDFGAKGNSQPADGHLLIFTEVLHLLSKKHKAFSCCYWFSWP